MLLINKIYSVFLNCEEMKQGRKEGNVLFNDALNTSYLWLYGVGEMKQGYKYFKVVVSNS